MPWFRKRLVAVAFAIAVAACASPAPPPAWIHGAPAAYPADRWLVGVGSGAGTDQAAAAARARLSAQTTEDTTGAAIAETWLDPKTGTHWALAVLDREPIRARLAADLAGVEKQEGDVLAKAHAAPAARALPLLNQALALDARRRDLRERLEKLSGPGATPASPLPDRTQLERRLAETKRALPIEIESWEMDPKTGEVGDPLDAIRRALAKEVIALGFPVSEGSAQWGAEPAWLVVRSRLGIERLKLLPSDRMVAVHWDEAVEVLDPAANGQLIAVLTDQGRATHLNEHEARREALASAEQFASRALGDWLGARAAEASPVAEE